MDELLEEAFDAKDIKNFRSWTGKSQKALLTKQKSLLETKLSEMRQILELGQLGYKNLSRDELDQYKAQILSETQIICTTLSQMGKRLVQDYFSKANISIEYLIIDEACQSVELSSLIPMQYKPKKVILIGDQN